MACKHPAVVREALINRLCAVAIGPYRVEYINNAGRGRGVEDEHLAMLERDSKVVDLIDVESEYFSSLVTFYGAAGVAEKH